MAARWKPSASAVSKKQESSVVVDDWENDEGDEEQDEKIQVPRRGDDDVAWPTLNGAAAIAKASTSAMAGTNGKSRVGGGGGGSGDSIHHSKPSPSPSPIPQILSPSSGRTLPTSILPPSTSAQGSAPQILRRDPNKSRSGGGAHSGTSTPPSDQAVQRKTLAEREKEYEEARRRIFGDDASGAPGAGAGAAAGAKATNSASASNASSRSSTPTGKSRVARP